MKKDWSTRKRKHRRETKVIKRKSAGDSFPVFKNVSNTKSTF